MRKGNRMDKYIEIEESGVSHIFKISDVDGVTLTDSKLYVNFKESSNFADLCIGIDRVEVYNKIKKALLDD